MTHIGKPSRSSERSEEATVDPSTLTAGDMVMIYFMHPPDSTPLLGARMYGRVVQVTQGGAWVAPCTTDGVRLARRKVYCSDEQSIAEEVNGESMF